MMAELSSFLCTTRVLLPVIGLGLSALVMTAPHMHRDCMSCRMFLDKIILCEVPNLSVRFPPSLVSNREITTNTQGEPTYYNKLLGPRDCIIYGKFRLFNNSSLSCLISICSGVLRTTVCWFEVLECCRSTATEVLQVRCSIINSRLYDSTVVSVQYKYGRTLLAFPL